jgi:5-methylcytosine-specific restriction protein A
MVPSVDLRTVKPSVGQGWSRDNDPGSSARGYGAAWQRLRLRILGAEPLCRACKQQGRVTAADCVDHILAKAHGGTDDERNLQPLCTPCHRTKTANEARSLHG